MIGIQISRKENNCQQTDYYYRKSRNCYQLSESLNLTNEGKILPATHILFFCIIYGSDGHIYKIMVLDDHTHYKSNISYF